MNAFTQEIIDYYARLLIIQYRNQPKAKDTIKALITSFVADNIIIAIRDGFNIDTAVGVQLDWLGLYIGTDRYYKATDYPLAFGFSNFAKDDYLGRTGFASASDFLTKEGTFLSVAESIAIAQKLDDPEYRLLLKVKIAQNNSNFSTKSIDDILHQFFQDEIYIVDNYDMTMTYSYDPWTVSTSPINNKKVIEAMLWKGILPVPMGVELLQAI